MAVITEGTIKALAAFRANDAPVTTCYLDVDGRRFPRHQDCEQELDALLRRRQNGTPAPPSVRADIGRIERHVRGGFDRARVRGLALFSCSARDWWEVIELPVRVQSQLVVERAPYVRPLERLVEEYEPFGVLVVDRQRARMLVYELGELVDRSERFDELARAEDPRGHVLVKTRVTSQVDERDRVHLRHAARLAFDVFQSHRFEHLVVGAPADLAGELEAVLHPYLRERLAGHVAIPTGATDEQIRRAALDVESVVERRKEAALVDKLRAAVGGGRRGVAGVGATLRALVEHRVETLLVSDGCTAAGWRCEPCGYLGLVGRACPVCAQPMAHVEDVVEDAVEQALAQSCRVLVCVGNADLDVLGGVGALLRF